MSLGTVYTVEISLETKGDLASSMGRIGGDLDRVGKKAESLGATFYGLGGKLSAGFTGAVETVGAKVAGLATIGVAGAIGAATYGVTSLNNQLQTTQVSLAAVLNSNGLTTSIEGGMERAAGWVAQMKKDARDLPGEFQDLLGIVQSSAGSAFQAGLDDQGLEKLASQTMAAAKALAIDMPQAGRDLGRLLGGSAGMDNMLGSRLGFTADNFNKLDRSDQVKKITEALAKFEPAIAVFGKTFDAQSSTLIDSAKGFATVATKELFERATGALGDINTWFENNQDTVKIYADKVSIMLTKAWDGGRAFVEEWWPSVVSFAERFYDRFTAVWRDAEPYISKIGSAVKGFLDDPEGVDKIEGLLKLYIAAKVGGGAASLIGSGAGVASNVFGLLGAGGRGVAAAGALAGGGKAAVAVAPEVAEWLALTKAASLTGKVGSTLGSAGQTLGAAGAGTVGLLGAIGAGTVGAIGATAYEINHARTASSNVVLDAKGGGAYGYSEGVQRMVDDRVAKAIETGSALHEQYIGVVNQGMAGKETTLPEFNPMAESIDSYMMRMEELRVQNGVARDNVEAFANATVGATSAADELGATMSMLAKSGDFEAIAKINAGILKSIDERIRSDDQARMVSDAFSGTTANAVLLASKLEADAKNASKTKAANAAKGSGNTYIAKVEITVSSNQAPGQIARDVAREFTTMRRYRTSSPAVQNFSAGR